MRCYKKRKEKEEALCEVRYEALYSKKGMKDGRKKLYFLRQGK